jgi:hypothetical protein
MRHAAANHNAANAQEMGLKVAIAANAHMAKITARTMRRGFLVNILFLSVIIGAVKKTYHLGRC